MIKCNLCLKNNADKTGSHIVPFFLLKKVDNFDNSKGRDKELGFVIGSMETKSYFGRGILPEKLDEIYGNLDDDKINDLSKSPFIKDNIFCSDCEKKLSILESEYSGNSDEDNIKSQVPLPFWISVLWRVSISRISDFKFSIKQENNIRDYLNCFFLDNLAEKKTVGFCYKIMRCDNYTEPLVNLFHPIHTQPYCFIIANYVIFFYYKDNYLKLNPPIFFGFDNDLKNVPISNYKGENVYIMNEPYFAKCMYVVNHFIAKKRVKSYSVFIDEVFKKINISNSQYYKKIIFDRMVYSNEKIGNSLNFDHWTRVIIEVLQEHGVIGS